MCVCVCTHMRAPVYKSNVTMDGRAGAHTSLKQEGPLSMFTYHDNWPQIATKSKTVGKTGGCLKTQSEERR